MPELILQWQDGWEIEDAIGWILCGGGTAVLGELKLSIERPFDNIDELVALFKIGTGAGRLKTDYLAYEEVVSVIGRHAGCRTRAVTLLEAITQACLGSHDECALVHRDNNKSDEQSLVLRLGP